MKGAEIQEALQRSHDRNPRVRRSALLDLCPCELRTAVPSVWDRVLEMRADPDASVRSLVLHCLCDGSPQSREAEVVSAVEELGKDGDRMLGRRARKVLARYSRTGRINQE